ncbi:MAG: CopD family protein [Hoeflea sp.]|nr:CopD family protein [Hoeflea sp.]
MIAILKFVHIATVAVWMASLVGLPGLYVQRARLSDREELLSLQRMVRYAYLKIMSPAAFAAVASGTGLIFLSAAFEPWLSAKLALVGLLAMIHTLAGLVIIRLFDKGEVYPGWRFIGVTMITLVLILGVLYLVLAKPVFGVQPSVFTEPGGLARLFDEINPWRKP